MPRTASRRVRQDQRGLDRRRLWCRACPAAPVGGFWLQAALAISATEQVAFLERLRRGTLRVSPRTREAVRGWSCTLSPTWDAYDDLPANCRAYAVAVFTATERKTATLPEIDHLIGTAARIAVDALRRG
jgi:hypothetical protein